jgi:hypothetical protein
MPHAILLTWKNMEARVLPHFIARAAGKYGADFHQLYFDSGTVSADLVTRVAEIPNGERLKVYISGHGGVGVDYITDDTELRRKTVPELVELLAPALAERAPDRDEAANTQVNMVSCLFGRTPDGQSGSSPAAKLHQGLADRGVYVELIARTESVVAMDVGRSTVSIMQKQVYEPVYGRKPKFIRNKVPYTKVRHTFRDGGRIISLAAFDGVDTHLETSTLEGRRFLWTDYVIAEMVKLIELKGTGFLGSGPKDVTDTRQQVIRDLIIWYDMMHNPVLLRAKMAALVDGTGEDDRSNFLKHRNPFSGAFSSDKPKTGAVIETLLQRHPT